MFKYLKYFAIPFVITVILTIVGLASYSTAKNSLDTVRHNDVWDYSYCVYDYAGKMTQAEVDSLNSYLIEIEDKCLTDIVFITIDDPEYGYLDMVHAYADSVSEECGLGYDGPGGSSIVFVDNWSRGGDGKIHSWMSTTGDVRNRLSDSDADEILYILDEIESDSADPYDQYYQIAGEIGKEADPLRAPFPGWVALVAAIVVAAIYIFINLNSKLGDVTVNSHTYVDGGKGNFRVKTDTFRNKVVTKRKIETSSGSGGGGGSHGGGGHSR